MSDKTTSERAREERHWKAERDCIEANHVLNRLHICQSCFTAALTAEREAALAGACERVWVVVRRVPRSELIDTILAAVKGES